MRRGANGNERSTTKLTGAVELQRRGDGRQVALHGHTAVCLFPPLTLATDDEHVPLSAEFTFCPAKELCGGFFFVLFQLVAIITLCVSPLLA